MFLDKNKIVYEEYTESVGSELLRKDYNLSNKKMKSILRFLDGKKVIIAGIIHITSSFLVLKGVIDADTGVYISTLNTLIFGTASVVTTRMQNNGTL